MFLPLGDDVDTRTLPLVGIVLIGINLLVFCLMVGMVVDSEPGYVPNDQTPHPGAVAAIRGFMHKHESREVIFRYGLTAKDLQNKRYVGLLTHMFLHADLMHLLGNMIVLWAFVSTLEHALGPLRFLGFYLLWGALAGLAQAAMFWGSDVPLVGASGAIAGVIGAYWITSGAWTRIRTLVWILRPKIYMIPAGVFVAIWICFQLEGIAESKSGAAGVAWYAHLGGFVGGVGTMLVFSNWNARQLVRKRNGDFAFEESAVQADRNFVDDEIGLSMNCPYCQTLVTDQTALAPSLARCPNAACGRLVLLDQPVAVAGASRSARRGKLRGT